MAALKACFFFLLSLNWTLAAKAGENSAVVKVFSAYNGSSIQPRLGSGLVIKKMGHFYVLTSDHVVFHSNKSFTHKIQNNLGKISQAVYLTSDAGRGLALLTLLDEPKDLTFYDMDLSAFNSPPLPSETVTLVGYPADSDSVLLDKKGWLNNSHYASDLFVELAELYEIKGGHGEFGMSGGAAFKRDGAFIGVLSHQILSSQNESVLLIPAPLVKNWLNAVLDSQGGLKHPSVIDIFQDPAQQVSDFQSLRTGRVYISYSQPFGNSGPWAAHPLDSQLATDGFYAPQRLAGLPFKEHTDILCFGFRRTEIFGSSVQNPAKLNLWMRSLLDPSLEPLWTYDGPNTISNVRKARALRNDFQQLAAAISSVNAPQLRYSLQRISDLLVPSSSSDSQVKDADEMALGPWRLIKPKDIDFLLNSPTLQAEWREIAHSSHEVITRQKLQELRGIVENLTF